MRGMPRMRENLCEGKNLALLLHYMHFSNPIYREKGVNLNELFKNSPSKLRNRNFIKYPLTLNTMDMDYLTSKDANKAHIAIITEIAEHQISINYYNQKKFKGKIEAQRRLVYHKSAKKYLESIKKRIEQQYKNLKEKEIKTNKTD